MNILQYCYSHNKSINELLSYIKAYNIELTKIMTGHIEPMIPNDYSIEDVINCEIDDYAVKYFDTVLYKQWELKYDKAFDRILEKELFTNEFQGVQ